MTTPAHRRPRVAALALAAFALAATPGPALAKGKGKSKRAAAPTPAPPPPAAAAPTDAAASPPPEIPADSSTTRRSARVVAVSAERVFLALGRADGVAPGARVRPARGGEVLGAVDVVSARRASFALAGAPGRVKVGDTLSVGVGAQDSDAAVANPTAGPVGSAAALFDKHLAAPAPAPPLLVAEVDKGRAPARRARRADTTPGGGVHGSAGLSILYVKDTSTPQSTASLQPLDFFQARIDSRLYANDLAGGHLRYDHRISVQFEGVIDGRGVSDLSGRPGWDARRWVRADWLHLTYLPVVGGPFQLSAGRLMPVGTALTGPTDGARLGWFGEKAGVSLTAGLAPQATNLRPDYRTVRAAVDAWVSGKLGALEARGELASWAALTDGQIDRVALSLALQLRYGRRFLLFGYAEGGWLPDDLRASLVPATTTTPAAAARDPLSLDRVHAFVSYTPASPIDIQLRYAFDRPVLDRMLVALLPREYLLSSPRHAAGATVRLRAGPVTLEPFGDIDLSADSGLRYRAGGRIHLDRFPFLGTRITLSGQYTEGATVNLYGGGVRLSQQLTAAWDLYGGYSFTLVEQRGLDERYSMHSGDAGVQLTFARRFTASLEWGGEFTPFGTTHTGFGRIGVWF